MEYSISIKRDDLIDEFVSGNKLYKLRLNIESALKNRDETIITFGGAYSNHIAATAAFAQKKGIKTIGIIRGEAHTVLNPTLRFARQCGMELKYVSRAEYRLKESIEFQLKFLSSYKNAFVIPEGGANYLGIEGCKSILDERTAKFDYVFVAMGTGTTYAGLVKAAYEGQSIIGLPIHKHDKLLDDILKIDPKFGAIHHHRHQIVSGYHFGGYAKYTDELLDFIRSFHEQTTIKLDPIYTGKAFFGMFDLLEKKQIPANANILFIHTGGLQGIEGFEIQHKLRLFDSN